MKSFHVSGSFVLEFFHALFICLEYGIIIFWHSLAKGFLNATQLHHRAKPYHMCVAHITYGQRISQIKFETCFVFYLNWGGYNKRYGKIRTNND